MVYLHLSLQGLMVWLKLYSLHHHVMHWLVWGTFYLLVHTCTHTHWQGTYFTHTCARENTQWHVHSHSRIVYSSYTLLVISPFPCTTGSWASAAFGGSACVGKMLFWQERLLWQITRWSSQCECVHFDVRLSTSYVNTTRSFHFILETQGREVGGTYILRIQCV